MRKLLSLSLVLALVFGCNQIDPEKEFVAKARAAIQQTNVLAAQLKYDDALMVIEPIFQQSSDYTITSPELRQEILTCIQNVDDGKKDYDKKIKQGYKLVGKRLVSPEEVKRVAKRAVEASRSRRAARQNVFEHKYNRAPPGRRSQIRAIAKLGKHTQKELESSALDLTRKYGNGNYLVSFFSDKSVLNKWDGTGTLSDTDWPYWMCRIRIDSGGIVGAFKLAVDENTGMPRLDVLKR